MFKNRSFLVKIVKDAPEGGTEEVELGDVIKSHFERNKTIYLTVGIAVITSLIMRSSTAQRAVCEGVNAQRALSNTASFSFAKQTINITTVLDREGRGHPGWPVRNLDTNRIFFSQREAAQAFDINPGVLSGHLKGKFPDANGLHFERVTLVPTA